MSKFCLHVVVSVLLGVGLSSYACAQRGPDKLFSKSINRQADGVLALLGFAVVPDITTSALSIEDPQSGQNRLLLTQIAGGHTGWFSNPVYLEGSVAYIHFDPSIIGLNPSTDPAIDLRWNALSATGGIGWDFSLTKNLVLRPILNTSVGYLASRSSVSAHQTEQANASSWAELGSGQLAAFGIGGSLMLDYTYVDSNHEIDAEFRYTNITVRSFQSTIGNSGASVSAQAASTYLRYRAPTGLTMLDRPLRYVLEGATTVYLGDQRGLLGFDSLNSVGLGIELDSSAHSDIFSRVRIVGRYAFGENVRGFSLGLGVSF